jgi:phage shock protein A
MEEHTHTHIDTDKPRSRSHAALWILVLALVAGNIYAIWQISETHSALTRLDKSFQTGIASVTEKASAWNSRADERVAELQKQLQEARSQASTAAGRAKTLAEKRAEQLVKELSEEYRNQSTQLSNELGQVKQSVTGTDEKVNTVMTDVSTVRTDVAQTKSDLETAISDLKSVRGDLGVQSGLIATNGKELAALRELGERHYFEFDIAKKGQPQRLGTVTIVLRKTNAKEGKFTMDVISDDRTVQKKDRTINEPVQFYTSGSRQPAEIVVNNVQKDRITGYLAIPKVQSASR